MVEICVELMVGMIERHWIMQENVVRLVDF